MGYSPWGCKGLDTPEQLGTHACALFVGHHCPLQQPPEGSHCPQLELSTLAPFADLNQKLLPLKSSVSRFRAPLKVGGQYRFSWDASVEPNRGVFTVHLDVYRPFEDALLGESLSLNELTEVLSQHKVGVDCPSFMLPLK